MKIIKQLFIIFFIYFLGVVISNVFSIPVPGSIIGMLLLFISLIFGIVKIESIETVSDFILDNLSLLFIPSGVGVLTVFSSVEDKIIQIFILCIGTTFIVMSVTAITVKLIRKFLTKRKIHNE